MSPFLRGTTFVLPVLAVTVFCVPESPARPDPPERTTPPAIPDAAAFAIVKEANRYIQDGLASSWLTANSPKPITRGAIRANALMISLVAQNRLAAPASDAGRLAALRETALKLAREVERHPNNLTEIHRLAARLDHFPQIPPEPGARCTPVRLLDTFNHDDVVGLFGSCGSNRSQQIERRLFSLARKTPITPEEECEIELLAYKVALITDLVREMDDLVPVSRAKERPEWVRLASEVQRKGWQLAETALGRDSEEIRRAVKAVNTACGDCHVKFRD